MNGPCKGCQDRAASCHDTCETYREWHAKIRAAKLAEREDRKNGAVVRETVWKAVHLSRKGRGKKWTNS